MTTDQPDPDGLLRACHQALAMNNAVLLAVSFSTLDKHLAEGGDLPSRWSVNAELTQAHDLIAAQQQTIEQLLESAVKNLQGPVSTADEPTEYGVTKGLPELAAAQEGILGKIATAAEKAMSGDTPLGGHPTAPVSASTDEGDTP